MTALLISSIAQWVIILLILSGKSLPWIEFEWNRTFFGKVRHGFKLILWRKTGPRSQSGKHLINFNWANPDSLDDKSYCRPKSLWAKPSFLRTK